MGRVFSTVDDGALSYRCSVTNEKTPGAKRIARNRPIYFNNHYFDEKYNEGPENHKYTALRGPVIGVNEKR